MMITKLIKPGEPTQHQPENSTILIGDIKTAQDIRRLLLAEGWTPLCHIVNAEHWVKQDQRCILGHDGMGEGANPPAADATLRYARIRAYDDGVAYISTQPVTLQRAIDEAGGVPDWEVADRQPPKDCIVAHTPDIANPGRLLYTGIDADDTSKDRLYHTRREAVESLWAAWDRGWRRGE